MVVPASVDQKLLRPIKDMVPQNLVKEAAEAHLPTVFTSCSTMVCFDIAYCIRLKITRKDQDISANILF